MVLSRKALLVGLALLVLPFQLGPALSAATSSAEIDVYILHSGKAKKEKDALIKAMDGELVIKAYNVDLLKLADYSGKQKAVAKIDRARHVVVYGEGPVKILKGTKFSSDTTIVLDGTRKLASGSWNLNIVAKGTDVSKLPNSDGHLTIGSIDDLKGQEGLLGSEAIVLENADRDLYAAVAHVVSQKLAE